MTHDQFSNRVAAMLKPSREDAKMDIQMFSKASGVHPFDIKMYEEGHHIVSLESFAKIVRALRADANAILGL